MTIEPAPYFEVHLEHPDGTKIPPERYPTVAHAMAAAEEHRGAAGAILFYLEPGADPLEMIVYGADGTIEVGADAPGNEQFEDEPWTEAELAANWANGRTVAEYERELAARAPILARQRAEREAMRGD
jgi:hypothetical protein